MPILPPVFITIRGDIRARVGLRRNTDGTVQELGQAVPDGDTLQVHLEGSGSVRFLGVDAPEMKLDNASVASERWRAFFADRELPERAGLAPGLAADLAARLGEGAAENHRRHAEAAGAALRTMAAADMAALGATPASFRIFASFSYETFDRYGRFLAFANREQPDADVPSPRPLTYNERLLEAGLAAPFFIWPNVAPFRDAASVLDAVLAPGSAPEVGARGALGRARRLARAAREAGLGVWEAEDPLRIAAFELRYLADGRLPDRAVIDLASDGDALLPPQSYHLIPLPEDRLFVPPEFAPAFLARGWRIAG